MDPFRFYDPAAVDKKKQRRKHTNRGKASAEPLPASPLFPPPPLQVSTGVPFLTCVATTVGDRSEYTLSREPHDHHSQGQVDPMRNSSEAETSLLIKAEPGVETETSAIAQDPSYFGSGGSHDNPIVLDEDVSTVESIETRCSGDRIQCRRSSLGGVENASTNSLAAGLPLEQPPVLDRGSPNAVPVYPSHD
ncbi:hypothetical protein CIRG_09887 [Coccidioides immitis RMSCC 2394]|uniref:Uncharacterized protein n=1 Tax=Coccidioides immitis RMSCC 2394 TaxID=404692 RepID=A0A0J6YNG2_COCIT|nr:hypothetical protein CIRG_09887 [Coccidioides immitis RMSCC 2394]